MVQKNTIRFRCPSITLSIVSFTLIVFLWPQLSDALVYDRQAILKGEIWRLVTAPFVHFSWPHLFWNLLVLAAAGWKIEDEGFRRYGVVCCFAAAIPGFIFLFTSPEIYRYGGLSGLATGAVVYLCLHAKKEMDGNRTIWLAILVFVGLKIVFEAITGNTVFVASTGTGFRVLPAVHLMGYAAALAVFVWPEPKNGVLRVLEGETAGKDGFYKSAHSI